MTKTCLLITERFEPTADLLVAELRHRGVPFLRWNLDQFPAGSNLSYHACNGRFDAEISSDGRKLHLDAVASIWCRGFRPSGLGSHLGSAEAKFVQEESQRALDGLFTMIGEQEKAFRKNPLGASSDIVKKVFGALGK